MAGTFGRALGRHLAHRPGRCYVQLPDGMLEEAEALVTACVEGSGLEYRAVLVTKDPPKEAGSNLVRASDLLAWRTDDDRAFVLLGSIEPDSSFASSVAPFMTSTFPGGAGGECSPEFLASCTVKEALPIGLPEEVVKAFDDAAPWVFELVSIAFEGSARAGSAGALVEHWADMVERLASVLQSHVATGRMLEARHAWAMVRLAGMCLPGKLAGLAIDLDAAPPVASNVDPRELTSTAGTWAKVVEGYVRSDEEARLLHGLDRVLGAGRCRWSELDWRAATAVARHRRPLPEVGQALFLDGSGTDELEGDLETIWRQVDASQLQASMAEANEERLGTYLHGSAGSCLLTLDEESGVLLLDARAGTDSFGQGSGAMIPSVGIAARDWQGRATGSPQGLAQGDVLVLGQPTVQLKPKAGAALKVLTSRTQGGELLVEAELRLKYPVGKNGGAKWRSSRKLIVEMQVRDVIGGVLQSPRSVRLEAPVILPSPFWPTFVCFVEGARAAPVVCPGAADEFRPLEGSPDGWRPNVTPELDVRKKAFARLACYDGPDLAGGAAIEYRGETLVRSGRLAADMRIQLDNEAAFELTTATEDLQLAVVRVEEAAPAPTTVLRRKAGDLLGPPSEAARQSPLGTYQTAAATGLLAAEPTSSLFHLVIPAGTGTLASIDGWGRNAAAAPGIDGPWPGLGVGPSEALAATAEWAAFCRAARAVARKVLAGEVQDWLSAVDPSLAGVSDILAYTTAHSALIRAARNAQDVFWARYPFSVVVVNGARGPERGLLQALLLSPMHPARLAWLFSVARHAAAEASDGLLGICEGWNVPAFGSAPTMADQHLSLVAAPLDPGPDGDLAPWSALVPTSANGIVRPPQSAAGSRLPWGGRSGLNEGVVRQALDDYVAVNPFVTSMQVELRSAVEGPRSREVDWAVMGWMADNLPGLGGSGRVLDSVKRTGPVPSRDQFEALGGMEGKGGRFSWLVKAELDRTEAVDVAFVENAAPYTSVVNGLAIAPFAALPVRRFPVVDQDDETVRYHYASTGRDIIGLADLLRHLEPEGSPALRVVTTPESIEAHDGVRWEVIGDINLEPVAMARVASQPGGRRQLWEWRPGWLNGKGAPAGTVRGAHYVIAQVPRSLIAGLERKLGLPQERCEELLTELGSRGVGIATLRRPSSTQEAEAAGLFYAARLLTGFKGCALPPSWMPQGIHVGLLPLDPLHALLGEMGGEVGRSRADLLLVIVGREAGATSVTLVPVEVKHRGTPDDVARSPGRAARQEAVDQARETFELLQRLVQAASDRTNSEEHLLRASLRLQTVATLVELALKFAPGAVPPADCGAMLGDVVSGTATMAVRSGVVLWFLPGSGGEAVLEPAAQDAAAEAILDPEAAEAMLWSDTATIDAKDRNFRSKVDRLFAETFCGTPFDGPAPLPLSDSLEATMASPTGASQRSEAPVDGQGSGAPQESGSAAAQDVQAADEGHRPEPRDRRPDRPVPARPERRRIESPGNDVSDGREAQEGAEASRMLLLGSASGSTRHAVVGTLQRSGERVCLDLDQPKAIGVFGYMGSGKSYLLGGLIEAAATPLPGLNTLPSPMAVVVFNYRRNAADRLELNSLAFPNDEPDDVRKLADDFQAIPAAVPDVHVLCLPGELASRLDEYAGLQATELFFKPDALDVEDWELLMGEPGSEAVFARAIRGALQELRAGGTITVEAIREALARRLPRGSMNAAELRLEIAERLVSAERGVDFSSILKPGRVLLVDLRQPMFSTQDAMKLILVCANQIAKQRVKFNKLIVFDEAHEYMTEAFGARFDSRIRYMRHEGSSYVFATQDVGSVPIEIRRHLGTQFVFSLETNDNIQDMVKATPAFAGYRLQHMNPGSCWVVSTKSTSDTFQAPKLVSVRPRATRHGGKSNIYSDE